LSIGLLGIIASVERSNASQCCGIGSVLVGYKFPSFFDLSVIFIFYNLI